MKRLMFALLVSLSTVGSWSSAQEPPALPKPEKEHEWLEKFVGTWNSELECQPAPGAPPMKSKGTLRAKSLGGFWIVSDMKLDMMGAPMNAIQTIGYDPAKKKYVGTWVDSMTNYMWKYEGWVDEAGKILTLEADGPSFADPGKMAKYRDIYEFKAADHLLTSSQMQLPDGQWVTFMTGNGRREAAKK